MLLLNPGRFGFAPGSLSGLTSHWDFSAEAQVTETGGNVEDITSLINGYSIANSVGGDRPAYNSIGVGINGRRTAEITDVGNEHLDEGGPNMAALLNPSGTAGYTWVCCVEMKATTNGTIFHDGQNFGIALIAPNFALRVAGTDEVTVTATSGLKQFIGTYDGALSGGVANLRINGTDNTGTGNRGGVDTFTLRIGESGFATDMEIAEGFTYDRELTLAEKILVEGYLTAKWGTPS